MNFQFEPLKKFFTPNPINNEVAVLRAQVRVLQDILNEEEEKNAMVRRIMLSLVELEEVELPLFLALEIFDYLHMEIVEDLVDYK
jgi:hypothetical protein